MVICMTASRLPATLMAEHGMAGGWRARMLASCTCSSAPAEPRPAPGPAFDRAGTAAEDIERRDSRHSMDFEDGQALLRHVCKMGLEGIVSKQADSRNRSGRPTDWLKTKCEGYRRA
jgi:hypothetical protein